MRPRCVLAVALHIVAGMGRLFLSGQTTCALLLGAGLLLRAQAALRPADHAGADARPAEMMGERSAARPVLGQPQQSPRSDRSVQKSSHTRKGFAHRSSRPRARKCGVALAHRGIRCG
jgi:hypothetical protein